LQQITPMSKTETTPNTITRLTPAKRNGARRLLIATIGAATVNYASGCGDTMFTSVANLMAPPILPPASGTGGHGAVGAAGEAASANPKPIKPDHPAAANGEDAGAQTADDDAGARR
jgi:hypothetical protein